VRGDPVKVPSEGVATSLYFRGPEADMAQAYGELTGRVMSYFTGMFGLPPYANLTVVETEEGAPNGYAAPGLIFLAPRGSGRQPSPKLIANQVSRQWWEEMVGPSTRNHLWLTNGLAAYSELLWTEHASGPAAMESQARYAMGDDKFFQTLKTYAQQYAWKSVNTDDFRKVAEDASGQSLAYFFIQWIESSGAPEFKLEYTIFRTPKGFRVMGKISQDLDTFRMPVDLKIETEGN